MFVFQDKIAEIDVLLERSRKKWHLDAVQWMDYDDVCQIIRLHVHKKWHLWDQTRTFGPWCNRVISHQITNLIRNHYTSFQKPLFSLLDHFLINQSYQLNLLLKSPVPPLSGLWILTPQLSPLVPDILSGPVQQFSNFDPFVAKGLYSN